MTDRKEKIMMKLYHTEKKDNEKVYYLDREHVAGLFAKLGKTDGDLLKVMTILLGLPGNKEFCLYDKWMAEWAGLEVWEYRWVLKRLEELGALKTEGDQLVVNIAWVMGREEASTEEVVSREEEKDFDDDEEIRRLLAKIGVAFSQNTREALENDIKERLDVDVLKAVIYDHPDSWIPAERKNQAYYFTVLKAHVQTDYHKVKARLGRKTKSENVS